MICKITNFLRFFFNRKKIRKIRYILRMKKIRKIRILDLWLVSPGALTAGVILYYLRMVEANSGTSSWTYGNTPVYAPRSCATSTHMSLQLERRCQRTVRIWGTADICSPSFSSPPNSNLSLSSSAISTHAMLSVIFQSWKFHSCDVVRDIPVLQFLSAICISHRATDDHSHPLRLPADRLSSVLVNSAEENYLDFH